jgi:hypothetical protein
MKFNNYLALLTISAAIALGNAACNNSLGGFSGSVGNTPPVTPETSYKVLGNPGLPFTALVSDARSSWVVQGAAPLSIAIVNVQTPSRIAVTKLESDNSLMSVEIINGTAVVDLGSTNQPYGTASAQTGGTVFAIAEAANPDLQINVTGPLGEHFQGLIEDQTIAFTTEDFAPAVYLFDGPSGKVTAQFFQVDSKGGIVANMTVNGQVVANGVGGPSIVLQE